MGFLAIRCPDRAAGGRARSKAAEPTQLKSAKCARRDVNCSSNDLKPRPGIGRQHQEAHRRGKTEQADRDKRDSEVDEVGQGFALKGLRQMRIAAAVATPNSIAICCSMLESVAAELRCGAPVSAKVGTMPRCRECWPRRAG